MSRLVRAPHAPYPTDLEPGPSVVSPAPAATGVVGPGPRSAQQQSVPGALSGALSGNGNDHNIYHDNGLDDSNSDDAILNASLDDSPVGPLRGRPLTPAPAPLLSISPSQASPFPSAPPSLPSDPSAPLSVSPSPPPSPLRRPHSQQQQQHVFHPPNNHQHQNPYHVGIAPPSPLGRQFPSPRLASPLPWLPTLEERLLSEGDNGAGAGSSPQRHLHQHQHQLQLQHQLQQYQHLRRHSRDHHHDREHEAPQDDPITRDSKDVLVQRLADLAQRVALTPGRDVAAMHARVDEMERSLSSPAPSAIGTPPRRSSRPPSLLHHHHHHHHSHHHGQHHAQPPSGGDLDASSPADRFWHANGNGNNHGNCRAGSPSWLRARFSEMLPLARYAGEPGTILGLGAAGRRGSGLGIVSTADSEEGDHRGEDGRGRRTVPVEDMKRVVAEVERLNSELDTLLTNLRARQEESDHIHSLLVERAERAAQRIIFLQGRVTHLEEELQENDSELQHLRIQLKAIELQCPSPQDMDDDLRQSIENWRSDWATQRQKRANIKTLPFLHIHHHGRFSEDTQGGGTTTTQDGRNDVTASYLGNGNGSLTFSPKGM